MYIYNILYIYTIYTMVLIYICTVVLILLEFQGDRQLTEKIGLPFLGPQLLLSNPSSDCSAVFSLPEFRSEKHWDWLLVLERRTASEPLNVSTHAPTKIPSNQPVLVEPMLQVKPPGDFAMRICNNSWITLKNQGIHITLVLLIYIYISEISMDNLIWSNLWFTISCYSQNRGQW